MMTHAINGNATESWRSHSSTLRKMEQHDRQRRWIAKCGDRLVSPASAPSQDPTCAECRELLNLPALLLVCADCNGTGEDRYEEQCIACDGDGEVVR